MLFAEVVTDVSQDPTGLIGTWYPAVALVLPFVVAIATRYGASKHVKRAVSVVFAVAVAIVSLLGMDWANVTPDMVAGRIVETYVVAEMTYRIVDQMVRRTMNTGGINAVGAFRPNSGIGAEQHHDV